MTVKNSSLNFSSISYQLASRSDLIDIRLLQEQNLKKNLSPEELREGFVTAEYTVDELAQMHELTPAVIAKHQEQLVGYALAVSPKFRGNHPLIDNLFTHIDKISYRNKPLKGSNYIMVGQLCVRKNFRKSCVSLGLYQAYKKWYSDSFDYLITDIVFENQPSLKAHQKAGFEIVSELNYSGSHWAVVLWNWN